MPVVTLPAMVNVLKKVTAAQSVPVLKLMVPVFHVNPVAWVFPSPVTG
jgi:hypothetical protein